jgi:membrane fusion protein (multidrug efflux system)
MQKSKIKNQNLIIALDIIMILSLLTGCQKKEIKKQEAPQIIPVKVSRVELKELVESIEYVGNVKAEDEVIVYPKVSGKIITKVKEDGSLVSKGEIIAYIDRDEVGLKFERAPVESPLTGIVGRIYVDIGSNVGTQTPIALVVNMDKVKINLDIPEKYLPKVTLGQVAKISVDAYPKDSFMGLITKISPVVDLITRTAPVEITLDNPGHLLKSGMFAKINLIIEKHSNVPVILKESVIGKEPDTYVYVIEDKKAVLRKISLGIRQGPYYEVREGLKEGDGVVIMGQQRLSDGAQVEMEENKE